MGYRAKLLKEHQITNSVMDSLADSIENYLTLYINIFYIPKDYKGNERKIEKAIKKSTKLIKKLRKHDKSVFNVDDLDENQIM